MLAWEHRYNHHRVSMALGGLTPVEKLRAKFATAGPTAWSALAFT